MNNVMKICITAISFIFVLFVSQKANSTCYTGTNNLGSTVFNTGQWTYSDITFYNFPESAKINRVDVNVSYRKNAGAFLKFFLKKIGSSSDVWFLNDWTPNLWSNYNYAVNNIQSFNNLGVNGGWQLSVYHEGLIQNPNPWGDYYQYCYQCHSGAQLSSWSLTICYDVVPTTPTLTSPANNYASTLKNYSLQWSASPYATRYFIQIAKDQDFSNIVYQGDVGNTTAYWIYSVINDFGTYYWRVKAGNDIGDWSNYSYPARSFTWYTTLDINPTPVLPRTSPPIYKTDAILTWTPPANGFVDANNNIVSYNLDVATDSSFTNKVVTDAWVYYNNTLNISGNIADNQTYYWRVRAQAAGVYCPYATASFSTNGGYHIVDFNSEFNSFNPYGGGVTTFAADFTNDPSVTTSWAVSVAGRNYNGHGNPGYFTWDGKDDYNKLVNPGDYIATLYLWDTNTGGVAETRQIQVNIQKPVDPVTATCETSLEICTQSSTNIGTGSVSHEQTLFTAKGATSDLSFTLYYNSLESLIGTLGISWTHNFDIALIDAANGAKIFRQGFTKTLYSLSGTTYASPANDFSTLVKNTNGSYTVTQRNGNKYYFDTTGRVTSFYSRYGKEFGVTYTTGLITITDASNRTIKLYTDSNNNLATVYDPAGNEYVFYYSDTTNPRLTTIYYPDSDNPGTNYWAYTYDDSSSRMLTKRDPNGNVTTYSYYPDGRMKNAIDPEGDPAKGLTATGHTRTMLYDPVNRQTNFYEKDGSVWQNKFDPYLGRLKQTISPETGKVTDYYYNSNGTVKAKSEPFGDSKQLTTFYRYDPYGNLTDISEPIDFTTVATVYAPQTIDTVDVNIFDNTDSPIKWATRYTYDYANYDDIASVTDLRGSSPLTTTYTRSVQSGLLVTQITAPGKNSGESLVTYRRQNATGTLSSLTDANGKTTTFTYYPYSSYNWTNYLYNMLASVTLPNGVKTAFTGYDKNGNVTIMKLYDSTGVDIQVNTVKGYDTLNRLDSVLTTVPGNSLTYQYAYDKLGNLDTFTDPETRQTHIHYNYLSKATEITDAKLNKTQLLYSGSGCSTCGSGVDQLNTIKDANHVSKGLNGTVFQYDAFGRLMYETDPVDNILHYTYYDDGLLRTKADATAGADTTLVTYLYNTREQITYKNFADGTSEHYTYYPNGWLLTSGNQNITYTYTYYNNGWLKDVTDSQGRKISYDDYDALGQRKQVTIMAGSADQHVITYDYDTSNRPWHITSNAGTFTYGYDSRGRKNTLTNPNQTVTSYGYDDLDRLTSLTHGISGGSTFAVFGYPYHDKMGNRLARTGDNPENYTYDELYRLTSRLSASSTESFTYDDAGNRLTGPYPKDTGYQYDDANQMTMGRTFGHAYDNQGNQISRIIGNSFDKSWTLAWDKQNRLTQMQKIKGAESQTLTFKYDPQGRRIEKRFAVTRDGNTKTSIWTYVYDMKDIALEIYTDPDNVTTKTFYIHGPEIDEQLALERSGRYYYYHADGLGSITAITDAAHSIVQSYDYSAYGIPKATTSFRNSYQFAGREWDRESHLYYNRLRYFDPYDGIFISRDPLSFAAGDYTLYRYTKSNPVNFVDPLGLSERSALLGSLSFGVNTAALFMVEDDLLAAKVTKGVGIGLSLLSIGNAAYERFVSKEMTDFDFKATLTLEGLNMASAGIAAKCKKVGGNIEKAVTPQTRAAGLAFTVKDIAELSQKHLTPRKGLSPFDEYFLQRALTP